jgi:hypothetical protein
MDFWNSPWMMISAVIGILVVALIAASIVQAKEAEKRKQRRLADTRQFHDEIKIRRSLPVVPTSLLLNQGEVAFFSVATPLLETRAVRQSQSGHVGVRAAKGVYAGTSKGTSSSTEEWKVIDQGQLVVTNQRIVFQGGNTNRSFKAPNVISFDYDLAEPKGVVILAVENRSKNMAFQVPNPAILSAIVQICKQVENPCNLAGVELNFRGLEDGSSQSPQTNS